VLRQAIDAATDDASRCDARIELASALLVQDRYREALEHLDQARPLAHSLGDAARLARLMLQQGNAHFALGHVADCMRAHQAALDAAGDAADPRLRASALSGLADAHYQRGRMITAHHHFDRCVRLCEAQGLVRLQASNLSGRAMSVMYLNRIRDALADAADALRLSTLTRSRREQALARNVLAIAAPTTPAT
jgi:tetratricopeptide (TPR) repeat protein